MGTDLVLKGTLSLGGTPVDEETTLVILKTTVNDVVVPATLATGTSHEPGAAKYEIQIDYLSDDADSGVLFPILWAAVATASKELAFTCLFRDGGIGVGNPQWAGTMVVSAADVGGDVEGLSEGSITCVLTGAPVPTTA
jgi:IMP dehydrogenase/GMP reductase